jgi:dolichol-phosphate mannosyltransferase
MVTAVIPALNEAETIGALVEDLKRRVDFVVVVDDGSTDETGYIAKSAGAMVIRHDTPQNIGPSIMEGLKAAMSDGCIRRFVAIDAGGSHNPADLPGLLRVDADIVIGSRFCPGGVYVGNPRRKIASRLAALMCRIAKRRPRLSDWTSGYRVYTRGAVGSLMYHNYHSAGHAWQIEILTRAIRTGMKIKEAPITYTAGRSSLSMKTIDAAFMAWLDLLFS